MAALSMTRGTSATFQLAVTSGGSPTDLTGAVLRFYLLNPAGSPAMSALSSQPQSPITITAPTRGLATITITPAMLGAEGWRPLAYGWVILAAGGMPPSVIETGILSFLVAPP